MSYKITGLDKVLDKLEGLQQRARALGGEHRVSLSELCNTAFMRQHTKVSSFEEFLTRGGYGITEEEFVAIPEVEFDEYVKKNTDFNTWLDMKEAAGEAYVAKQLKFD